MSLEGKLDERKLDENPKGGAGEYEQIFSGLEILRDLTDNINKGYTTWEEVGSNIGKGLGEFYIGRNASLEEKVDERKLDENPERVAEKYEQMAGRYEQILKDPAMLEGLTNDIKNGNISLEKAGSYLIKGFWEFYIGRNVALENVEEFAKGYFPAADYIQHDLEEGYLSRDELMDKLKQGFEKFVGEMEEKIKAGNINKTHPAYNQYLQAKKALKSITNEETRDEPIYFRGHTI